MLSRADEYELTTEDPEQQKVPRKRRRGRPSLAEASRRAHETDADLQEPPAKRKRGRPSGTKAIAGSIQAQHTQERKKPRISQARGSQDGPTSRVHPSSSGDSGNKPKKRGRPSRNQEPSPEHEGSRRGSRPVKGNGNVTEYQHLEAVERKVSRQTIDSRWEPLSGVAIERVTQLMGDVEKSVVMRLRDEKKRNQAATAINLVARRLQRKLIRGLPFPPSTRPQKQEDFNLENILDNNAALENRLTPMIHSIELLKAEIKKETLLLDRDSRNLERLEANAKADAARRKKDIRNNHFLLQTDAEVKNEIEGLIGLADRKSGQQIMRVSWAAMSLSFKPN